MGGEFSSTATLSVDGSAQARSASKQSGSIKLHTNRRIAEDMYAKKQ
jgi:hypothetical protein